MLALMLWSFRMLLGYMAGASDITTSNIAEAINSERSKRNIPLLRYDTRLAAAAEYKAEDMIARHYFSHKDPDGNFIWNKIVKYGYKPYLILGENLAINFSETEGLVAAWITSPRHRDNILNPDFKDQGVGISYGKSQRQEQSSAIVNTFGSQPFAPKTEQIQGQALTIDNIEKKSPNLKEIFKYVAVLSIALFGAFMIMDILHNFKKNRDLRGARKIFFN